MQFFLFTLATAMLFLRPSELLPELGDFELYRYVIAACLAVSLPVVFKQLSVRFPGVPPVAGCVLCLLPAVLLSHLSHARADDALAKGVEFLKVLAYFLLLLGLVNSLARLKTFLCWLGVFSAALALISVARYHADANLPPPAPRVLEKGQSVVNGSFVVDKVTDPETGGAVDVRRMCGTGIFNDPNDLALALVTAIPLCLAWLTDPRHRASRPLWLGLLCLFGYALMLTHSRGAFLALVAGLGAYLQARFGGKKTLLIACALVPAMFAVFAGRMTSISTSDGTAQSRIQLWSDALMFFQQAPFFGNGMETYRTFSRHVAHNSYLHSFTELGLFGGTLFVAAFYFALRGLLTLKPAEAAEAGAETEEDAELRRLHPYVVATFVAYAVGIAFLSRGYVVPTYLLLGLATVYLRLYSAAVPVGLPDWHRFLLPKLAGVGFSFLIASYTFVRLFVNWR